MDSTVLASVVGAVATLVATGFTVYFAYIYRRDAKDAERRSQDEISSKKFSYRMERLCQTMTLLNDQGDCRIEREYRGIHVNPGLTLTQIAGFIRSGPEGEITKLPTKTWNSDVGSLVEVHSAATARHEAHFTIDITGGLAEGDPPLSLRINAEMARAHRVRRADIEASYANDKFRAEYFGIDIDLPIDVLELEVRFEPELGLDIFASVFHSDTEDVVTKERQRIRHDLAKQPGSAKLTVEKPKPGYTYVLYWAGS
jgi:hypothetical protein